MSMSHDEMIAVIQAHKEGKEIQFRCVDGFDKTWSGYSEDSPSWDFSKFEYRIKPEPLEFWVNVYKGGNCFLHTNPESASNGPILSGGVTDPDFVRTVHLKEVQSWFQTAKKSTSKRRWTS